MANDVIRLIYEEWLEKFTPLKNPINPDSAFDGHLINTSEGEIAWLTVQNRAKVWTLLDTDGVQHISEGWHFVNRIGYFVTKVPRLRDDEIYDVLVYEDEREQYIDAMYPPIHFVSIGVSDVRRELGEAKEGGFCYPVLQSLDDEEINDLLLYCYKKDMIIWEHAHVDISELEKLAIRWLPKAVKGGA